MCALCALEHLLYSEIVLNQKSLLSWMSVEIWHCYYQIMRESKNVPQEKEKFGIVSIVRTWRLSAFRRYSTISTITGQQQKKTDIARKVVGIDKRNCVTCEMLFASNGNRSAWHEPKTMPYAHLLCNNNQCFC